MGVRLYVGPYYKRQEVKSPEMQWVRKCPKCLHSKPQGDKFCGHCGAETPEVPDSHIIHYGSPIPGLDCHGRYCFPGVSIPTENMGYGWLGCVQEIDTYPGIGPLLDAFAEKYPAEKAELKWGAIAWDDGPDD